VNTCRLCQRWVSDIWISISGLTRARREPHVHEFRIANNVYDAIDEQHCECQHRPCQCLMTVPMTGVVVRPLDHNDGQ
jgi:hypothetical protein